MMAYVITGDKTMKNDNFRRGYRDALMGWDFVKEDNSPGYFEGVAKAMRENEENDTWNAENLTYL